MNIWIILSILIGLSKAENLPQCVLPRGCRTQKVNGVINPLGNEKVAEMLNKGLRCDIFEGFSFCYNQSLVKYSNGTLKCDLDIDKDDARLEMRLLKRDNQISMFDQIFQISNIFKLTDANGFENYENFFYCLLLFIIIKLICCKFFSVFLNH